MVSSHFLDAQRRCLRHRPVGNESWQVLQKFNAAERGGKSRKAHRPEAVFATSLETFTTRDYFLFSESVSTRCKASGTRRSEKPPSNAKNNMTGCVV
jgi:hypothetical protein